MSKARRAAYAAALGFTITAALTAAASGAQAQTIKIGFISSYSGLNGNLGPHM